MMEERGEEGERERGQLLVSLRSKKHKRQTDPPNHHSLNLQKTPDHHQTPPNPSFYIMVSSPASFRINLIFSHRARAHPNGPFLSLSSFLLRSHLQSFFGRGAGGESPTTIPNRYLS